MRGQNPLASMMSTMDDSEWETATPPVYLGCAVGTA